MPEPPSAPHAAAARLASALARAMPWLSSLPDPVVRHRPTPDRWSIAEVLGHLIDSACNNHQRFIRAQGSDRFEFPKYDQNVWAERAGYDEVPWATLLECWSAYNQILIHVIERVPAGQFGVPCTITPYDPCTLDFLLTDYVDHLEHHLQKIRERIPPAA